MAQAKSKSGQARRVADPRVIATKGEDANAVHAAFEWLRSERIESLNISVEEYRHRKTGARHFHLAADNPENVFLVALRTVPMDSTGVAHILEHTVLCGSERYPVRDPFFMMIRRSLNTFMNAFTSSDWTAYPFASQNRKDFNNLMDVYLDAVLFSRLHELDFAQEGHRVEFAVPDDPGSDLVFKGVVFNEMKGAMSSPINCLWQSLSSHLFPTTTYHHNSGGDPEHIPDLSYEQLKDFYKTHYHPSNAVFMTYGDIPAIEHHDRMQERALARFERLDSGIVVNDEKRYSAPVVVEESYALDAGEAAQDKTHIVLGWLLGRSISLEELLKARLLSGVLLDNSASPLRHALETTELGSAPSPLCGTEDSNREMSFMCGLEGSRPENAAAVETLVLDVLSKVAEDGVPQERVEAVLHQIELSQREVTGDGYPYGLQLLLEGLSPAIHLGDPVAPLNLDPVLEQLRQDIKDPDFIKALVREWLIENPHRVRLTMRPDTELSRRRQLAEAERLTAMKAAMSDADKTGVVDLAARLAARQQQQDDPDILPKVGLEDVPAGMQIAKGTGEAVGGSPLTYFAQGTNGLVYQEIVTELPALDGELLSVMPYYTACLPEVGCGGRDYLATQAWQASISGGINAYTSLRGKIDNVQDITGHFVLSGKALARNHSELCELMQQTLEQVRFDELGRIRELISQQRARLERSITGNGHNLAMTAATSGMSPSAAITHRLRGLAGIQFLKQLDDGLDDEAKIKNLADSFGQLHARMLAAPRQFLVVAEQDIHDRLISDLKTAWGQGADGTDGFVPFGLPEVRRQVRQLWVTSTQVNFCAKAYPTVPIEHEDAAALSVLGGFLRNGFLHRTIREQGGAYGGGAGHETGVAAFRFYSYRDPRLKETLEDFDRAIDWLLNNKHEWRQVEEAILGVVSGIDKPGSPVGEAKDAFYNMLYGRTPEQRERFRKRVLGVSLDELKRVGETYFKPERASVAIITNSTTLEQYGDFGMEVFRL